MLAEIEALQFLSRLCGGEEADNLVMWGIAFLSRLCGGEDGFYASTLGTYFLSRLCGGEGPKDGSPDAPTVSKPPMWR